MQVPKRSSRSQSLRITILRTSLAIWSGVLIVALAQVCAGQTSAQEPSATASSSELSEAPPDESGYGALTSWWDRTEFLPGSSNGLKILNIVAAALIGFAGASAFYAGVRFGFISSDSRDKMLQFLQHPPNPKKERVLFYAFGGVVAAIFQWAQPDVLAPIQAFVLGATWPSVVTRIMSGSTPTIPSAKSIVDTSPTQIKTDEKGVEPAIVVVTRKSSELESKAPAEGKNESENESPHE